VPTPSQTDPVGDEAFLTGDAPTPDLLRGVWRKDDAHLLLRFTEDGEVRFDDSGSVPTRSRTT
jgi:hypothetical protein